MQLLQKEPPKNVELRVRTDEQLPQVAGDPESLLQVFLNLGQNALQAMPDGGTLEILTTRRRRIAPRLRPVLPRSGSATPASASRATA